MAPRSTHLCWSGGGSPLGQRRRRWPNGDPPPGQLTSLYMRDTDTPDYCQFNIPDPAGPGDSIPSPRADPRRFPFGFARIQSVRARTSLLMLAACLSRPDQIQIGHPCTYVLPSNCREPNPPALHGSHPHRLAYRWASVCDIWPTVAKHWVKVTSGIRCVVTRI